MKTLSFLSLATFVVIGLTSCDKEDISITPTYADIAQPNNVEQIDAESDGISPATLYDVNAIEFGIKSDMMVKVNRVFTESAEGGQMYDLSGTGEGISPNYGKANSRMRLLVDGETGIAKGQITYNFEETGISIRFSLRGQLDTSEKVEYSTLISKLLPNHTYGLESPSGRGKTIIFGDLFHNMQHGEGAQFQQVVATNALITE